MARSPYSDPIIWRQVELPIGADVERRIPRVEVASGGGPILGRGVAVCDEMPPFRFFVPLAAPQVLGEREKELLWGRETVAGRDGLARAD